MHGGGGKGGRQGGSAHENAHTEVMRCRTVRPRVVLLVGGDQSAAESCAREVAPLPVVRAKHLAIASDRLRSMRPVAVFVAPDVTREDARELERLAEEHAAKVIHLELELELETPATAPTTKLWVARRTVRRP